MPTNDDFDTGGPLPRFLAEQAEQEFGNVRDEGVVLARLFKVSLAVAAVAVAGIAVLALGNPLALFSDATASLAGSSSSQPVINQPPPVVQAAVTAPVVIPPAVDAQAAPPVTATPDAPAREEVAAAEPAVKPTDAASEALFRQFQAWVVEQDAQPQPKAEPVQPVQDPPPAPIMREVPVTATEDDVPIAHPPTPKRRHVPPVHDAQIDPRAPAVRKPAPRPQEAHAARPPVQHVQDARAQEPPPPQPQPAQSSSFLPIFGQR